ncbi:uncharacterized protein DUF1707 [Tamaricihabitans halophyticus]|uniref:Uncharacterized protein DUF1707 n=1 Tax=Tamaricihabitans halophyticus TaxID=1262583 RepID=A0A4R2R945_9PSEU|nr:DUF1707 domain-containing protein [Tamaricihabitans halophyticus]TCP56181.1 uncharacterized protein DUF1707 [Tamaricihabitans halophyticus]
MSAEEESRLRLSDAERQEAIDALGEHFQTGRLDMAEYGERTAQVTAARLRSELRPLFDDLPEPKPSVLREQQPQRDYRMPRQEPAARQEPYPRQPAQVSRRTVGDAVAAAAIPIAVIVAVVLFFTVAKVWMVFMLPVLVGMFLGAWRDGGNRRGCGRRFR